MARIGCALGATATTGLPTAEVAPFLVANWGRDLPVNILLRKVPIRYLHVAAGCKCRSQDPRTHAAGKGRANSGPAVARSCCRIEWPAWVDDLAPAPLGAGTIARNTQALTPSPTSAPPFWTPDHCPEPRHPPLPHLRLILLSCKQDDPLDISSWRGPAGFGGDEDEILGGREWIFRSQACFQPDAANLGSRPGSNRLRTLFRAALGRGSQENRWLR
jgi:hypothetical protein